MSFFNQAKITGAAGATLDGTAGSPSTGVLTVQGVASGTAIKVDGSAATQPISGTVSINAIPSGSNVIGGVELVDSAGTNKATISAGGAVKVDGSAVAQPVKLQDGSGNAITSTGNKLDVNATFSGSISGNAAASATGSAVPAAADYLGAKDGSGNLVGLLAESVTNPNLRVAIYNGANEASVSAGGAVKVDGSAVTQPVSAASLPLPSGAATAAKQPALGTAGTASADVITVQGIASMTALKVDGSAVTQPVSAASLPLPSGASTSAKQPALGTAGSASADVITVQGVASMTALKVDGSAVTQPVSGTVSISGTVATSGNTISEGTYNNTPPAPSDPSVLSVQLDQAGNLRTFAGIALKALSAQPATSGQSQVIFTNSGAESVMVQLTQTTTLTAGAITFEVSYDSSTWGTIPAQCVVDPTSSTFAAISLPYTVQASTNKQFLILMNGAQALRIKTSTTITGTGSVTPNYALLNYDPLTQVSIVGTPSVSVTGTVTANQGGAPWSVSGSGTFNTTDANAQSQGSTTSGQKGFLEMGAVTTAAPTYTTAQTSPLSLTTAGALRVDGSGVTQPVSASQTGNWTARIVGNAGSALDAALSAATAPTNGVATLGQYNTTIPAPTAAQTVAVQVDSTGSQYANTEGRKATYSAFATFTAAAGDIAVMPGSATKTIRVTRVEVSLSTSGTAALETVELIKRSTADTGGTTGSMVTVPHDSNFSAASAAPTNYTAAPTTGTAVGPIRGIQFNDQSASLPGSATWLWEFGTRPGASAVVLRGTAQQLCVNLGGAVSTQTATVSYEWSEE